MSARMRAKHEGGEPPKLRGKSTTQATVLAPLDDNLISASVERKYRHPWFLSMALLGLAKASLFVSGNLGSCSENEDDSLSPGENGLMANAEPW